MTRETVDRLLVGGCALIWLAVVAVGVVAITALVELGSPSHGQGGGEHAPSLLYVVIAVSAVIILAAIPLLVRARRAARAPVRRTTAVATAASGAQRVAPGYPAVEASTEKLRVFGSVADRVERPPRNPRPAPAPRYPGDLTDEDVDRVWLRAIGAIVGTMGLATLAVATATYFFGVAKEAPAWVALGLAAALTVAMPVVPWLQLRELSERAESPATTEPGK